MAPRLAVVLAVALAVVLCAAAPTSASAVDVADGADEAEEVDVATDMNTDMDVEMAEIDAAADAETDADADADADDESEADVDAAADADADADVDVTAHARAYPPVVFLIRHGEKPYPDNKELSARGQLRAKGLVKHFAALSKQYGVTIGGVYAQRSAFEQPGRKGPTSKRPVDTVVPLAAALKLPGGVSKYWPEDYPQMVKDILSAGKAAVICWEHDALTDVGKAFGVKLVWPEGRYDVTYVLTWSAATGKPSLTTAFQNLLPGDVNADGPVPPSVFVVPCDHVKQSDAKTKADQSKWKSWFSGSYALQYGAVRTVVAQKGCQKEVADVAKHLEAKMIDKLEKPKDVTAATQKALRENGVVLVVAERNDIAKVVKQLGHSVEKAYAATGAGTTFHLLYDKGHSAAPTFKEVKHT